ncbi:MULTISPECIES: hypothetical protein [unclassified Nodularia (in: cyanobacteria)]|uniref:hypothetical protein n=1 Tax=unclassified Nodularia (in: cyanobacteria) TaxID=2656917 RepID=UPI00188064EA|nr:MULTISPECIES: hypothetical protein [unclassified Nodularia (in: cyanobacteria)]MBE9199073.1 hypothetical protein [Nodularia sp. LEGE 06071]MCC2694075.1 hypothetical protein [Nodularia sp. LEGE 04288]
MRITIIKMPCISGIKGNTTIYEIVAKLSCDFLPDGITRPLDMSDLLEIVSDYDETRILNDFEFVSDWVNDYSVNQWNSSQEIRLEEISVDDIYPEENWSYFTSGVST